MKYYDKHFSALSYAAIRTLLLLHYNMSQYPLLSLKIYQYTHKNPTISIKELRQYDSYCDFVKFVVKYTDKYVIRNVDNFSSSFHTNGDYLYLNVSVDIPEGLSEFINSRTQLGLESKKYQEVTYSPESLSMSSSESGTKFSVSSIDDFDFYDRIHVVFDGFIYDMMEDLRSSYSDYIDVNRSVYYPSHLIAKICNCHVDIAELFCYMITVLLDGRNSLRLKNDKIMSLCTDYTGTLEKINPEDMDFLIRGMRGNKSAVYAVLNVIFEFMGDYYSTERSHDSILRICGSSWMAVLYYSYEITWYQSRISYPFSPSLVQSQKNPLITRWRLGKKFENKLSSSYSLYLISRISNDRSLNFQDLDVENDFLSLEDFVSEESDIRSFTDSDSETP